MVVRCDFPRRVIWCRVPRGLGWYVGDVCPELVVCLLRVVMSPTLRSFLTSVCRGVC